MFCKRNMLKTLSSDVFRNHARSTTACSHHVTVRSYRSTTWRDYCGGGMGEAWCKAENKGYILTAAGYYHICPHAVQTKSMLITTCHVKAQLVVATPGSWLHPWHPQIFRNTDTEDLNQGVTFSLVLSLIVFCAWLLGCTGPEEFVVLLQMMMCWYEPMKNNRQLLPRRGMGWQYQLRLAAHAV